jgi:hypothetical protein
VTRAGVTPRLAQQEARSLFSHTAIKRDQTSVMQLVLTVGVTGHAKTGMHCRDSSVMPPLHGTLPVPVVRPSTGGKV